jgi:hypothetical protein
MRSSLWWKTTHGSKQRAACAFALQELKTLTSRSAPLYTDQSTERATPCQIHVIRPGATLGNEMLAPALWRSIGDPDGGRFANETRGQFGVMFSS